MGNQGKHAAKCSACLEIQCQIILVKFKFSNICEFKTYDNRTKTLLIKFEEFSCVRKREIIFFHANPVEVHKKFYKQLYGRQQQQEITARILTQQRTSPSI